MKSIQLRAMILKYHCYHSTYHSGWNSKYLCAWHHRSSAEKRRHHRRKHNRSHSRRYISLPPCHVSGDDRQEKRQGQRPGRFYRNQGQHRGSVHFRSGIKRGSLHDGYWATTRVAPIMITNCRFGLANSIRLVALIGCYLTTTVRFIPG